MVEVAYHINCLSQVVMDIDSSIETLRKGLIVCANAAKTICLSAIEILAEEPQVLRIMPPVIVCGDIHGQFYDLKELFRVGGEIPDTKYLFLGDLVDRGYYSVETILLLLALKIKHPERLFLVRGNHESRETTLKYGFYEECKRKYEGSLVVWQHCTRAFDFISLSAVIGGKVFCVHGGLSPSVFAVDEINEIKKGPLPYASSGPASDLVWSDPGETNGWEASPRGSGFLYGPDIARQFNHENNTDFICRSHQLAMDGYAWNSNHTVITVWSAPNYCYRCGNVAAIAEFDEHMMHHLKTFEAAPVKDRGAPYRIPSVFFGYCD